MNSNPVVDYIVKKAEGEISLVLKQPVRVFVLTEEQTLITIEELQEGVCESLNIRWGQIAGRSRKEEIKWARFIYCWLARKHFKYSSVRLAAQIKRDHSSILNAWFKVDKAVTSHHASIIRIIALTSEPVLSLLYMRILMLIILLCQLTDYHWAN